MANPLQDGAQLQTLLTTLQQTNQALGVIAQRLSVAPALAALTPTTVANLGVFANDAAAAASGVVPGGLYLNSTTFAVTARHS